MKKFVALMCALLMVLSMAACTGVTTNDDAKANATDDANDGDTKSTVIADSNNDGQIEVGTVDDVEVNQASEHLDAAGHAALANAIYEKVIDMQKELEKAV